MRTSSSYPPQCLDLVEAINDKGSSSIECRTPREAHSLRTTLYAFFRALAREKHPLAAAASNLTVRVHGSTLTVERKSSSRQADLVSQLIVAAQPREVYLPQSEAEVERAKLLGMTEIDEVMAAQYVQASRDRLLSLGVIDSDGNILQ